MRACPVLTAVNKGQGPSGTGGGSSRHRVCAPGSWDGCGSSGVDIPCLVPPATDSTLHLCGIHGKVSVALPSCTRKWVGRMPAPPARPACFRVEPARDGEVAQGPGGHVKAWPSPNTYTSEAHASQVSHSSVYFGDSCRTAWGRENTWITPRCRMSLVSAKNWSKPQHLACSASRMLARMGTSWLCRPLPPGHGDSQGLGAQT